MTKIHVLGSVCCLTILGACATVTRGTTNQIQIMSEPSGASVKTSLNQSCTTPCTLTVGRKDEFSVVFNLAGYKEQIVEVKTRVAGAGAAGFVGNVIVGGVIGMGADAVTGATLEQFPNPVEVKLQRLGPPPKLTPKEIREKAAQEKAAKAQAAQEKATQAKLSQTAPAATQSLEKPELDVPKSPSLAQ